MGLPVWVIGGGVITVAGFVACSSDPSCEETRTCGTGTGGADAGDSSGGSGGSSGDAGAGTGGSAGGAGCSSDQECRDALACNGQETCVGGACVPGAPIDCPNPDPNNCTASCVEADAGSTCIVEAADDDGDLHGTASCAQAAVPGNDCDDSDPDVHPGAVEACDGVDGDCDGLDDLADGLPLAGSAADFVTSSGGAEYPNIAWSGAAQRWGIVWQDSRHGDPEIYYAAMDASGGKASNDVRVTNANDDSVFPRLAWGSTTFGVVWEDSRYGNPEVMFRALNDGGPVGVDVRVSNAAGASTNPQIARAGSDWLVVWTDSRSGAPQLYGRVLADGGTAKTAEVVLDATLAIPSLPRLALTSTGVHGVWLEDTNANGGTDGVRWGALDATPKVTSKGWVSAYPTPTGHSSNLAFIAAGALGEIVGWTHNDGTSTHVRAAELSGGGTVLCTAPSVASAPSGAYVMSGTVHSSGAMVVYAAFTGSTASLQFARAPLDGTCSFVADTPIATNIQLTSPADVGYGPPGFAVVWGEGTPVKLRRRVFGANFCD